MTEIGEEISMPSSFQSETGTLLEFLNRVPAGDELGVDQPSLISVLEKVLKLLCKFVRLIKHIVRFDSSSDVN